MDPRYAEWIELYLTLCEGKPRGICGSATAEMIRAFPELTRVPGFVFAEGGARFEHYWCTAPDGAIVDPTASQFWGIRSYVPFQPGDVLRVGRCANCGEEIYKRVRSLPAKRRSICGKEEKVVLWEDNVQVRTLWDWLITRATQKSILEIPIGTPEGSDIRELGLTPGQALLLKHWQRTNNVGDCWTISPWGRGERRRRTTIRRSTFSMNNVEAVLETLAERLRYLGNPGTAPRERDEALMAMASAIDDVLRVVQSSVSQEPFVQIVTSGGDIVWALDAAGGVWWISAAELIGFGAWALGKRGTRRE